MLHIGVTTTVESLHRGRLKITNHRAVIQAGASPMRDPIQEEEALDKITETFKQLKEVNERLRILIIKTNLHRQGTYADRKERSKKEEE